MSMNQDEFHPDSFYTIDSFLRITMLALFLTFPLDKTSLGRS